MWTTAESLENYISDLTTLPENMQMWPTTESLENHISDLTTMPENMQLSKILAGKITP